jgi:nitrogen fixation protein FixH
MTVAMARGTTSLRGHWIPWLFVAGFAIVIAVNATLIVYATDTYSGLVVEHPYKKGLAYNQTKAQLDAQARLGWRYDVAVTPMGDHIAIELRWIDATQAALDGLALEGSLQRPVENLPPLQIAFEPVGGGRYRSLIALPKRGAWDLHFSARRGSDEFAGAERLMIR